jgi:hypothetical protein
MLRCAGETMLSKSLLVDVVCSLALGGIAFPYSGRFGERSLGLCEPKAIVLSYVVPQGVYGDPGVHRAHSEAASPISSGPREYQNRRGLTRCPSLSCGACGALLSPDWGQGDVPCLVAGRRGQRPKKDPHGSSATRPGGTGR